MWYTYTHAGKTLVHIFKNPVKLEEQRAPAPPPLSPLTFWGQRHAELLSYSSETSWDPVHGQVSHGLCLVQDLTGGYFIKARMQSLLYHF